jgi:hypothetical protein
MPAPVDDRGRMSISRSAPVGLGRVLAASVGWHALAAAVTAVATVLEGFALLVTLLIGEVGPGPCLKRLVGTADVLHGRA